MLTITVEVQYSLVGHILSWKIEPPQQDKMQRGQNIYIALDNSLCLHACRVFLHSLPHSFFATTRHYCHIRRCHVLGYNLSESYVPFKINFMISKMLHYTNYIPGSDIVGPFSHVFNTDGQAAFQSKCWAWHINSSVTTALHLLETLEN